jgi:hypothetical protein
MTAPLHPALRGQIDEVMERYERTALTQARIDAVRDERARQAGMLPLADLIPPPRYGGGLYLGGRARPDARAVSRAWRDPWEIAGTILSLLILAAIAYGLYRLTGAVLDGRRWWR